MKKRGFTLAEILVTLSIIAIASALLAPAYNKMRPDKYKFKVLDCYRLASEATEALLSNAEIYYRTQINSSTPSSAFLPNGMLNSTTQWGCNGLVCDQMPTASGYNQSKYSGFCKYPNLMTSVLKLENVTDCNSSNQTASGIMNGSIMWIFQAFEYNNLIVLDMDISANSPNCVYGNCSGNVNPDRFTFIVNSDGDIIGNDPLTRTYLRNMANTDRTADFEEAAQN